MLSVPNGAQSVEAHCCSGLSVVNDGSGRMCDGRQMSKDVRMAQCSVVKPVGLPLGDFGGRQKVLKGQKWLKGVQVVSSLTVVGVNSSDQCG